MSDRFRTSHGRSLEPEPAGPRCYYCRQPIDTNLRSVWRRIQGWEMKALPTSRKSGSDIVLRERLEEYACAPCIMRLRSGLSSAQGTLDGDAA